LCADIPSAAILLNHPVSQIEKRADGVLVSVGELERDPWVQFMARLVILALPPNALPYGSEGDFLMPRFGRG
jgi:monoamine oxidase